MAEQCPLTALGRYGTRQWPCTLRAGHDGKCEPQIDARHYAAPLEDLPHGVLVSELRLALTRLETRERTWSESTDGTRARLSHLIDGLEKVTSNGRRTVPTADLRALLDDVLAHTGVGRAEAGGGERCPCHGWRKVEGGEAGRVP